MGLEPHDDPGAAADPIPGRADLAMDWTDNVARMRAFIRRHPHVSILAPRLSGTGQFVAIWIEASADPAEDGVTQQTGHERLGALMNHLEARFSPAPPRPPRRL